MLRKINYRHYLSPSSFPPRRLFSLGVMPHACKLRNIWSLPMFALYLRGPWIKSQSMFYIMSRAGLQLMAQWFEQRAAGCVLRRPHFLARVSALIHSFMHSFIHSFSSPFYDRSIISFKASSPQGTMQCFSFQIPVSSRFKVNQ